MDQPTCIYCNKKLRAYKTWKDWAGRSSHYACYKRDQQDKAFREMIEGYKLQHPSVERV